MKFSRKQNAIAFVAAAALIGLAALYQQATSLTDTNIVEYSYEPTPAEAVLADNGGDGYVVIFGSLACPHCRALMTDDLDEIIERAPGKVVYRNVIKTEFALTALAHVTLACVPDADRGRFVRALYENQDSLFDQSGKLVRDVIFEIGGLDVDGETGACIEMLSDDDMEEIIGAHNAQRDLFSLAATPTIVVDGQVFVGRHGAEELGL